MRTTADDTKDLPERKAAATLAMSADELGLAFSDVVVILACNDQFVPYLSVALQSTLESASPSRHYDVVVLTRDISPANVETLRGQVVRHGGDFGIGFLDVAAAISSSKLPRRGRFKAEASFRLMAPILLERVDKAIYLDCDLVVLHDLAELFDIELADNLLGATRDADTAGLYSGYDPCVREHLDKTVGLAEPYTYFQSGVLLLNLDVFRRACTPDDILAYTHANRLRWPDQDILNHFGRGRYVRIDTRWNVLNDWQHLRRGHIVAQAPAEIRDDYDAARRDPHIVHYAGPDGRPWLYPGADMADAFWRFAEHSPYYDEIVRRLHRSRRCVVGLAKRLQVAFIYKFAMPALDVLLPPKTRRRHFVFSIYERLGGRVS